MAQKEREPISERTRGALAAAKARGAVLGESGLSAVYGACAATRPLNLHYGGAVDSASVDRYVSS